MFYYSICSNLVNLSGKDSYIYSKEKLGAFDILVVDTDEHGMITCRIDSVISDFDAVSMPFELRTYLMKKNVETYLKEKQAERKSKIVLEKVERKVSELKNMEKLRKYANDPEVKILLEQYDKVRNFILEEDDEEVDE